MNKARLFWNLLSMCVAFSFCAEFSAGQNLAVRNEVKHDVSAPLREMVKDATLLPEEPKEAEPVRTVPLPPGFKPSDVPDPVLQKTTATTAATTVSSPALASISILNQFEGIGSGLAGFNVIAAPPDTNGAVGLTQYVQWVNLSFAVFDKTTGAILPNFPVAGNTLWTGFGGPCESNNDGDIIVLYDQLNNRWVFGQFAVREGAGFLNNTFQCVAVSTTSDATGSYNRYAFEFEDEFDDYPKMAVWPDAYYATFNMFNGSVSAFPGADACAFDGNAMRNGQEAIAICFQQDSSVFSLLPSNLDGQTLPPAGSPNFMVNFGVNSLNLYKFHADFNNPANSTFTGPTNIPVAPFTPFLCSGSITCVPQNSTAQLLDSLGDRLMYRLAYRNFGSHESLVVNHSVVADPNLQNSGVRWYEIQNPGGTPVVAQQSTFAPDSSSRWMGSIAMDGGGDLALGYSVSSSTMFPSIAITGQAASDPRNTLQAETSVISGTGAQDLNRWGDYSAMQIDPADDCTFWYTTEYLLISGAFNWNTRIANFKFPGCGSPDLKITSSHSGEFTQGQTGAYSITVQNVGGLPTDGSTVTVTEQLPTGLTATALSSTDATWSCNLAALSCTRNDILPPSHSYPAITVNVRVAADAPSLVVNQVMLTGGGDRTPVNHTAFDPTVIIVTGPDLTISKTHVPLVLGQSGQYSITVTNVGLSPSDATKPVIVTDTLPSGITAVAAGGPGWGACSVGATVTCSRSDSLASNQSYPAIVLTVSIANNAPLDTVNTATVAGGGDVNPFNNTAFDPAELLSVPPGLSFTSPAAPFAPSGATEFKPGTQISISGTATGPSFQDFRLQWAEGLNPSPSSWSSSGITLAGSGTAPVNNGFLGTWDTSAINTADFYSIRLIVDDSGFSNEVFTLVYLDPSLLSVHWPVALTVAPDINSGFVPATDASGKQRLALIAPVYNQSVAIPPQYLIFAPDGSSETSVQITIPSYLNPAAGTVEGVAGDDVVVPDVNEGAARWQMQFFRQDNPPSSFSFQLPSGLNNNFFFSQPVLEDLEGKGQLDVISLASVGLGENPGALFAWRPDGSLLLNGSVPIPDNNIDLLELSPQRIFVADLLGNGSKEIIAAAGVSASEFTLLLFAHDGSPIPWNVPVFQGHLSDLVLADLDHNGQLETILLVSDTSSANLHVFQPDGSERPGFPLNLGLFFLSSGKLAVGDLDRDGIEEIIAVTEANNSVVIVEPDGTSFPGPWSNFRGLEGPIALADIDGDGFPEILLSQFSLVSPSGAAKPVTASAMIQTTRNPNGLLSRSMDAVSDSRGASFLAADYSTESILALHYDGTLVRTWNVPGANGNQPSSNPRLTIGDFDQDGITDIAINNFTVDGGQSFGFLTGGVALVLTTGTKFNGAANDWPMLHHDPHNTSVLRRDVTLSITAPAGATMVSGTIPVMATTAGPVASVQFKLDGINLGAPVQAPGPYSISWDTTQAGNGPHAIVALATDSTGRPIASAPTKVTVIGGKQSSTISVTLTGSNPANFGASLIFQATVIPNTATGDVIFFDRNTPISGNVPLNGNVATLTISSLSVGTHVITVQYSGDSNFGPSVSPLFDEQILAPSSVTLALIGGSNPANIGDLLTFQAKVTPISAGGFVVFLDGDNPLSGNVGLQNEVATFSTSTLGNLGTGNHVMTAQYSGDTSFGSSVSAPLNEKILATSSLAVALTSGNNPAKPGDLLSFQATVIPNTATGSVMFFDGSNAISGNIPVSNGVATLTTSSLSPGTHSISAQYSGDSNFGSSVSGSLSERILSSSSIALALTAGTNPAKPGDLLTLQATVTPNTATGSVIFLDGSNAISGNISVSNGVATMTTSSLSSGTHSISAQYSGDSNFGSSVSGSLSERILSSSTTILTLTTGGNPAKLGDSLTFQATVTPSTATGTVAFFDGKLALGSSSMNSGSAVFTTTSLAGGTHSLTAQYSGDTNFVPSASPAFIQNVMDFNVSASPSSATITAGASAVFTFTITPIGGFSQTISFSCAGLPALSQCSFAPASVTPNGSSVTSVLTISTTASSTTYVLPARPQDILPLYASIFGMILGATGFVAVGRNKLSRNVLKLGLVIASMSLLLILVSCGGSTALKTPPPQQPGTPPGTDQLTVTVSSGVETKTVGVTLVVQ